MLISPAYAQVAPGGGAMDSLGAFLPLILIFVIFYFLLIRPQQKRMKDHKAMLEAIRRGDRVVTNGGIVGTVVKVVSDTEVSLEIAEGVRVRVMRDMIANVMSKTEPVSGDGEPKGKAANEEALANSGSGESAASKLKGMLSGKKS